ncbi:uncharacterized protein LOC127753027 isoform X2 [Oryza glaberrima]|uniref:Bifunctional inhibitor/plant lipid transfer protein/seed storage helical domain-containing protein n=1 Tax=Oryza glaberrima TaxID=4538 RepID=I1QT59_ORYGL|nr:uncharacterized protein LOC127753027 isoform X2 [Oryza glaberrima]
MEHIGPFLLAAMAVAAAVAAESETATTVPVAALPPLPALPVTAAASTLQPGTASCMDDLMPCATVSDDPTMLTPCCEAVAEVLKSDPECLCKVAEMSRNNTRKLASVSNNLDSDQQLFAQCKITDVSSDVCHKDKGHQGGHNETDTPAGDSSTDSQAKNASPPSRLSEAFRILFLLQILFIFGV